MAYILVLDQGTTSSRAILVNDRGNVVAAAHQGFGQIYPQPGWVEHSPEEIWQSQLGAMRSVVAKAGIFPDQISALGIANQRETVVAWDRETGEPIGNAIVWQCRRTAPLCDTLKKEGWSERIKDRTGLVIDSYFSGTKIAWILENRVGARRKAEEGSLLVGTIDSWLLWKLTGGKVHATDVSNASRTMLYDIKKLCWDEEILDRLGIPIGILPEVKESSGKFGAMDEAMLGAPVPICGVAGDQQAALFGQACFHRGMAKSTYGTGAFLLMNTGNEVVQSDHGLLTTIAWSIGGKVEYALEGSIFIAGAAVQWLRNELGLIAHSAESEELARAVPDTGGVYVVPAFVGLGAPHWNEKARGTITGITRGTNRNHIVRAVLESIAYQVGDVLGVMEKDSGVKLQDLRVDGGASVNNFLMQFQADILGVTVRRPPSIETTSMGAAYLAGLSAGLWRNQAKIESIWGADGEFQPQMEARDVKARVAGWRRALRQATVTD